MNQPQNPNDYTETFSGTNSKMLTTAFLLVILIGAVGLYFAMKPRMLASQINEIAPNKEITSPITGAATNTGEPITLYKSNLSVDGVIIEFKDVKLCSSFEEEVCVEAKDNKITRGDNFYVFEEIISTNPNPRNQVYEQSLKIEDDEGNIVYENKKYDDFVIGRGINISIPVKVLLYTFENDKQRQEKVTFTFQNKYTREKIEKTITYELV